MSNEQTARVKIDELLRKSGWRFFDDEKGPKNIILEYESNLDEAIEMGNDYQNTKKGYADYVLLDDRQKPLIVLEAKKEKIHPLHAKEQARRYALSIRAKYIILSNGNLHYFWNLKKGEPTLISEFPTYDSIINSKALTSNMDNLRKLEIDKYFIALSQDPALVDSPIWKMKDESKMEYCLNNDLRVLRDYQLSAVNTVKMSLLSDENRFLFEMATGTGKTLTAAAVIKMFVRADLVNRVLFLVDRIELENQAEKDLKKYLAKDGIKVVIYKDSKDDWHSADVVISTVQSFIRFRKYKKVFKPNDFDLVISDEAHRSLGRSSRVVFEYFLGYKLGLTATPKNYLKGLNLDVADPREIERRILLDTYETFGCSSGNPTYSYTLNDGTKDGILVSPVIVDARTEITTQLLSDSGLVIKIEESDEDIEIFENKSISKEVVLTRKSFERKFFSESTNETLVKTFLQNALRDPISGEIGKSIIFCVNIEHARKITEMLNKEINSFFPGMYQSNFACQITSNIPDHQQMTINFANNRLLGKTSFLKDYESSKARIAVTVGMMTTGYDCPDLLNIVLFRPIFSPSDFIQIKGRGTRLYTFKYDTVAIKKSTFKVFDYFAVCEYFEEDYNYDEKLKMPKIIMSSISDSDGDDDEFVPMQRVVNDGTDTTSSLKETYIGVGGMKIDRMFYKSFTEKINEDEQVKKYIENKNVEELEKYIKTKIFDKPTEYFNIQKLELSLGLDRKLTVREVVLNLIGLLDGYKMKADILKDEFDEFKLINHEYISEYADKMWAIENIFEAYLLDDEVRKAISDNELSSLMYTSLKDSLIEVKDVYIRGKRLLEYIKIYVAENNINCNIFN